MKALMNAPLFEVLDSHGSPLESGDVVVGVEIHEGSIEILKADGPYHEDNDLFWDETWWMATPVIRPLNEDAEDMIAIANENDELARRFAVAN